jgi:subtilisin family serine protease
MNLICWITTVNALFLLPVLATLGPHRKLNRALAGRSIPGQYIIELNPSISDSRGFATHVLKRAFRDSIIETYYYAMKGFAVKDLPNTLLNFMLNLDDVLLVSEDAVVEVDAVQIDPTWGLDIVDGTIDRRYNYTYTGLGVEVYILDTGIQANHSELEGRVESCVSFTPEECGSDLNGHGTHVAGTVGSKTYGVAKTVSLHDVKVLNAKGSGSYSAVIAGVDYVTQIKMSDPSRKIVINMSLGGGISTSFNNAITSAADSGVVVVVAAGNSDDDACNYSPASASGVLAVGSIDSDKRRSSWSNWGSCVDIFAPGSGILSLSQSNGTTTKSGTSMAAPHVAGVAALYLQAGRSTDSIASDALENGISDVKESSNRLVRTSELPPVAPSLLAPTRSPTRRPTPNPTGAPVTPQTTKQPTRTPFATRAPTKNPTLAPAKAPTRAPTKKPTLAPTKEPTRSPTKAPTRSPTKAPTRSPTKAPTRSPSNAPTPSPVLPQCQSNGQVCTAFRRCCSGFRCLRSWSPQRGRHRACRPRW